MHGQEAPSDGNVTDPAFTRALLEDLVRGTRMSNALPADDPNYAHSFPGFASGSQPALGTLTGMMQGFVEQHGASAHPAPGGPPMQTFGEDVSDRFDSIVDLTDRMLERVDGDLERHNAACSHALDQPMPGAPPLGMGGAMPNAGPQQQQQQQQRRPPAGAHGGGAPMGSAAIKKPQMRWWNEVDNSSRPFVPKLRSKPNALVNLELRLEQPDEAPALSSLSALGSSASAAQPQQPWYANPYTPEINAFAPSEAQLTAGRERLYAPLHATPCTWVDTEPLLQQMVNRLASASQIAIDLESHSYRSYRGFVCVMQISTRDEDFLVDAIELRSALHALNGVFTDARVTKVMHGADSDINWLQRDFGLYVVGLFDTGQAARVLEMQSFALAHLLKHYCGVTANKAFQMADWRIRPLTEDMITYAREDTHYLLYIYDRIKTDLAQQGRTAAVWQRSAELCRQAFKVLPFDPDAHLVVARRQNVTLTPQQLAVHRVLFAWRDAVAREEDESPAYVLPNHLLTRLATAMPQTPEQLHSVCHPLPPLLHYRASSLLAAVGGAQPAPNSTGYYARGRGNPPPPSPHLTGAASASGGSAPMQLVAGGPSAACAATMHPMQPSLMPPQAKPPLAPPAHPAAPAGVCAPQSLLPSAVPMSSSSGSSSAQALPPAAAPAAAGAGASGRVRCPPAPTRSPPLPPDQVYTAAGWVPSGAEELASALLPGGRAGAAGIAGENNGSGGGSGIFLGWSSGSSEDEEGEEAEEAHAAKAIQQQLNASPLWVLGMFAPADAGTSQAGAAAPMCVGGGAEGSSEPSAVPRSLTEIYKLSNQNKRRGAAVRRPSEELPEMVDAGKAADEEGESSSDGAEDEGEEDGGEEDEEEGDGARRRRAAGDGSEAWVAETNSEATEEFMRRIGWLRPDAEMPTGAEGGADAQRAAGGAPPRRGSDSAGEVGFGGALMPTSDAHGYGREPPPLPFQRQLPPHMPAPMRPGAPPTHQHGMPQPPSGAPFNQMVGGQSTMPSASAAAPPMPPMGAQDPGKKPARPRHKKRPGYGSGDFDYNAADSPFVFGAPPPVQRGGPPHGGRGGGGGVGGSGGKGAGGQGGKGAPAAGNRSMTFGAPGKGGGGGGGRRY